jgi:hypothetical protein
MCPMDRHCHPREEDTGNGSSMKTIYTTPAIPIFIFELGNMKSTYNTNVQ